jgi:hypothetical protein
MGFEKTYRKRLRVRRSLANEFTSCRQFLTPDSTVSNLDNDQLRITVLNRAIEYSLTQERGFLKILNDLCDNSRQNGANIEIDIKAENWAALGDVITKIKSWKRMNEGDLLEYVLANYINEMKNRRGLP